VPNAGCQPPRTQKSDGGGIDNGIEPGRELRVSPEVPQCPESLYKHILRNFLSVFSHGRVFEGDGEYKVLMPFHQFRKELALTIQDPGNYFIISPGIHSLSYDDRGATEVTLQITSNLKTF
jgi:hypothetical protein